MRANRLGVAAAVVVLAAAGGLGARELLRRPRLLRAPAVLRVRHFEAVARTAARVLWRAGPVGTRVRQGQKLLELGERNKSQALYAPFDGTVVEIRAAPGDVASTRMPVLVVAERGAIEAEATVPAEHADALREGAPVMVRLRGRHAVGPVRGRVVWMATTDTRAVAVRIRLEVPVPPGAGGLDGLPCDATIDLRGTID